ncbi:hypothetical protein DFH09DRAFT_1334099 [Mycena vulgaris]|nr:hypothetical protein DFH09DRAFT_1334099 [Mycena vulgaris]
MQYKLFLTLFLSSLALSISAAPISELSEGEPILQRTPEPEPGCKMYTCFWCVLAPIYLHFLLLTLSSETDEAPHPTTVVPGLSTLIRSIP